MQLEAGRTEDVREVTSGLLVLDLLLSQEASEGDNVGVDLLGFLSHGGRCFVRGS